MLLISIFSVEIILRAEAVETAQAGDKCDFVGTLIVVPDVGSLSMPGVCLSNSYSDCYAKQNPIQIV